MKKMTLTLFVALFSTLIGCSDGSMPAHLGGAGGGAGAKSARPVALDAAHLASLGFRLPANQAIGDLLPPQPGSLVMGHSVKGGRGIDTNWTAFTLVLFLNERGKYEVLTQMRAIAPVGTIETPGGHLTGGQNWRDGAAAELGQEAGINVSNADLFFLSGAKPTVSRSGKLYGNANFLVVFTGSRPHTQISGNEVDRSYGHKWIDLKTLYDAVKAEQSAGAFVHGTYYSFFRGHLINFVDNVLQGRFKANVLGPVGG